MTLDKEKIRAAALAATQGEWKQEGRTIYALMHEGWRRGVENFKNRFYLQVQFDHDCPESEAEANATHIATSNPATVLSLLDALDKAEKDRDVLIQQLLKCRDFFEIDWVNPGNVAEFTLREIYSTLRSMKGGE